MKHTSLVSCILVALILAASSAAMAQVQISPGAISNENQRLEE
jgi:hypothetical protein